MIAKRKFKAVVGGKPATFLKGDAIPADVAKELGLASKPHLAGKAKRETKSAKNDHD